VAQQDAVMALSRTLGTLVVGIALGTASCAGAATEPSSTVPPRAGSVAERSPLLPASALPRMTSAVSPADLGLIAAEVTHPDELSAVLTEAGFVGARQRSFSGGTGPFTRVIARGMRFESAAGARAYVSWLGEHASSEIVAAERISPAAVDDDVVVFHHRPDGCCHNDAPIFLAGWTSRSSVLYLYAGGRRATSTAFMKLIAAYDSEA
jgi:hypothetical protein